MLLIIFLLVTTNSWQTTTQATPVHGPPSSPVLYPRNENSSFSFSGLESQSGVLPCTCTQLRSTWDILWSCLATIFACTWVAVHPNSPGADPGKWKATLRRVELMIWAILTPEMIILWALRQWLGARRLARTYKGTAKSHQSILEIGNGRNDNTTILTDSGWTMTHAHFLQMGGFVLSSGDRDLEVLAPERFEALLEPGGIQFPKISADDIKALGKGDGLSKTIVFVQALWFIAQCISRAVQGLVITEVELVTVAFCFLNGFMYFLWWDKPLDATFVVRLQTVDVVCSNSSGLIFQVDSLTTCEEATQSAEDIQHLNSDIDSPETCSPKSLPEYEPLAPVSLDHNDDSREKSTGNEERGIDCQEKSSSIKVPPKIHVANSTGMFPSPGNASLLSRNAIPGHPSQPKEELDSSGSVDAAPLNSSRALMFIWRRMGKIQTSRCIDKRNKMRPPIFGALVGIGGSGAESGTHYLYYYLAMALVATTFGGIHCVGWRFAFPSYTEKILWRVASLIISVIPCIISIPLLVLTCSMPLPTTSPLPQIERRSYVASKGVAVWLLVVKLLPIYLLARLILLVEAFIAIRKLPQGAYVEVEWMRFMPHI